MLNENLAGKIFMQNTMFHNYQHGKHTYKRTALRTFKIIFSMLTCFSFFVFGKSSHVFLFFFW